MGFLRLTKKDQIPQPVISTNPATISDYRIYLKTKNPKRALLCYLPQPVIDQIKGHNSLKFSNDGIATTWPKVLNKLGYIVDIIGWDDRDFNPQSHYDLFVGHGAKAFEPIHKLLPASITTIYFSTGSYWKYHNNNEAKRLNDFYSRHGIRMPKDRYIDEPEEYANSVSDGIICLGNDDLKKTYNKFEHIYSLPIGCYPDSSINLATRDFEKNRYNFIFFSGSGNIHKGLDLVLDAFSKLPKKYNLHICTYLEDFFSEFYKEVLSKSNIHYHGFTDLRSKEFYALMQDVNYLIFPSCSEGSPGSVVECMMQGVIPIVSTDAHIDIGASGVEIGSPTIDSIRDAIVDISSRPEEMLKKQSENAKKIAHSTHSPSRFEKQLSFAVKSILDMRTRDNK